MFKIPALWRANIIVFIGSFCVMVIELIAGRILAPHIGVSLYTWTSIIGVILAGIALGNYLGGKVADKYPSPLLLSGLFVIGGLLTIGILPATKMVSSAYWLIKLPVMWNFTLTTGFIFLLPAIILSMVSPMVIKLTLADLGRTGGVVGTIYACSTAGSILGTFMTGFYFILWFGTGLIVWLVAAILIVTGIIVWFSWKIPNRWRFSIKNLVIWLILFEVVASYLYLYQIKGKWLETYTAESNYYAIKVEQGADTTKLLVLDKLIHSYSDVVNPEILMVNYIRVFSEIVKYLALDNPAPRLLHLGGGGYAFPRYLEAVYPDNINEVVEIDPMVTQVAYRELGLSSNTSIKTYNQDARRFLMQRDSSQKYDIIIGDVFNDLSTPYHLTTVEFDKLVKANMTENGIYLVNVVDDFQQGRYLPSFCYTLSHAFNYIYLFNMGGGWENINMSAFVIAATDRPLNLTDYRKFITDDGKKLSFGNPYDEDKLDTYLSVRNPILLTDDYAPTDILVASLFKEIYSEYKSAH